jgi:hypothetical protein
VTDWPLTPEEMRARLVDAPPPALDDLSDESYGAAIEYVGKLVLQAYERHPDLRDYPIETEYDFDGDPAHGANGMDPRYVLHVGLTDEMETRGFRLKGFGLTGNQVYEGVGAARFALGLDGLGNPAIVTVTTDGE